jgi:hypothetical protein
VTTIIAPSAPKPPLAYTGIGFLLVMNRMVDSECGKWAQWVLLFTMGGFLGNFTVSLMDHAANGFFFPAEYVPVVASAAAIGFLCVPPPVRVSQLFIDVTAAILVLESVVGPWGFVLHTMGNLQGPSIHPFREFHLRRASYGSAALPQPYGSRHHRPMVVAEPHRPAA